MGVNVAGKVALVTGSGGGIGEGIAKRLACAGATVIINDIVADKAERVTAEIRSAGGKAAICVADVSSPEAIGTALAPVVKETGPVGILVNNTGIARDMSLRKMEEADWDIVLKVNLKSAYVCSRLVSGPMVERKWGRIINITSRAWLGWWGQANYSASKGGLVSLTRTLATELARYGITVNAIAPGLIRSPMLDSNPPEVIERLMKAQPSGKIGNVDDVAYGVHFFASEESSYVTGQILYICGGKSLFAMPDIR